MNAVEILGSVVIVSLLIYCVAITALFLRSHKDAFLTLDRVHERSNQNLQKTLDRLMAVDFATFKTYEMAENAPSGGYEDPVVEQWAPVIPLVGLEDDNGA